MWPIYKHWAEKQWEREGWKYIPRKKAYLNKGWSVLEKVATEASLKTSRSELTVESPRQAVLVATPSEAEESTVTESWQVRTPPSDTTSASDIMNGMS